MNRSALTLLALLIAGCSFTEIPPPPGSVAVNKCDDDNECGGGRCRGGMCTVSSTTLRPLLIEVTAPSTVPNIGGLTFYTQVDNPAGNIEIGVVGKVTTTIATTIAATDTKPPCFFQGPPPERDAYAPSGGTITAGLTFVPSERVLGIAAPTYLSSTGEGDEFVAGGPYTSTTNLPSGTYDIYVEPRAVPGLETCDVPPFLIRGQEIMGGTTLSIELPEPSVLDLRVRASAGDHSLEGWSVAVLDLVSGRVLSVPKKLQIEPTDSSGEYVIEVPFVPAHVVTDGELAPDAALQGDEIVRLAPPEPDDGTPVAAPTFLFQRNGLRLSNEPGAPDIIDLTPPNGYSSSVGPLPPTVTIEGQTTETDSGIPVAAAVTLVSEGLEGASSRASFITTIQVDETGTFRADIPAGDYYVRATPPPSLGLSAVESHWQFHSPTGEPGKAQAGKTIELPRAPTVSGEAFANGSPIFGATASTVLSPFTLQNNILERTFIKPELLPRASDALVEGNGSFTVSVDPGLYDFFIRPEARSHYPWLVLPRIDVPEGGKVLRRRKVTLPVVHRGSVVVDDTANRVPGALIRAYVSITIMENELPKTAMIPVAETRADDTGAFELLIPASLDEE